MAFAPELDPFLSDMLLKPGWPIERHEVAQEAALLANLYAPNGRPDDLIAAALALEQPCNLPPGPRSRLRLWAAALRAQAEQGLAS